MADGQLYAHNVRAQEQYQTRHSHNQCASEYKHKVQITRHVTAKSDCKYL